MKRISTLRWYAVGSETIPWWLGYVRDYELSVELAPIPINWVVAFWYWLRDGLRYRFMPRAWRWDQNRRALWRAFERGREVGHRQGRVAGLYEHNRMLVNEWAASLSDRGKP